MTNPDIPTDNSEQVALLPCLYDATPEQIERANAAVDANLINGVPRWGSAQGYACALTAIMQSDARLSTIPNVDELVERLRQGVIIMGFGPGQAEMVDTVTANQAMRKAADRIEAQSHTIRVMREAAEIGLEYVIEAANQRKEKDAVFDNAMRDIERIESALGVSGHD